MRKREMNTLTQTVQEHLVSNMRAGKKGRFAQDRIYRLIVMIPFGEGILYSANASILGMLDLEVSISTLDDLESTFACATL
jgi:hypothetical protein